TKITRNWFTNMTFDFLGKKKIAYIFTSLVMIGCIATLSINGLNYGTDFTGGRSFQIQFDNEVDASAVSNKLSNEFDSNVEAKVFGKETKLKITTKYRVEEEGTKVDQEVNKVMYENLKPFFKSPLTYEQ